MNIKKSTINCWGKLRLTIHRSLAKGGLFQFLIYFFLVLIICGIVALLFRPIPINELAPQQDYSPNNKLSAAVFHLLTNGGQNMLKSNMGWLVTIIGIILVAIVTSLFTNWFDKIALKYINGETHYKFNHHIAVFGYHEMLPGLIKQLMESDYSRCLFLVQTSRIDKARTDLSSHLTQKQMNKVILQKGAITSVSDIHMMCIDSAQEIYILGEEMKLGADSSHDIFVLQCLKNVASNITKPYNDNDKIFCHLMFEHHSTFSVFQHTDLNKEISEKLAFLPFNYYEMWARQIFVNTSLTPCATQESPYLPLEGTTGIGPNDKAHTHLIVIGMSRMGIAMGIEAAHLGHYPNFIANPDCKTRISFIDRNARTEMYHLQGRIESMFQTSNWRFIEPSHEQYGYSDTSIDRSPWRHPLEDELSTSPYKSESHHLGKDFIDVEWEFIQGDVENPAIQDYLRLSANDSNTRLTVAVCVPDSNQSIAIALNLPSVLYEKAIQVLVYQRTGDAIAATLSKGVVSGHSPYSKLKAFGMSDRCYDLQLVKSLLFLNSEIAKKWDELFPPQKAQGHGAKESNDKSLAAKMWSNIYNACHMWTKLRSVGSKDGYIPAESIPILSKTEHVRWIAEQLLTQFRPLTEDEQKDVIEGRQTKKYLKERMAHLDICSCERLEDIDSSVVPIDDALVKAIYALYEKHLMLQKGK